MGNQASVPSSNTIDTSVNTVPLPMNTSAATTSNTESQNFIHKKANIIRKSSMRRYNNVTNNVSKAVSAVSESFTNSKEEPSGEHSVEISKIYTHNYNF